MVAFTDLVQDSFKDGTNFCKQEFPPLWNAFVDAFQDQLHARGRAAAPPATKVRVLPVSSPPFDTRSHAWLRPHLHETHGHTCWPPQADVGPAVLPAVPRIVAIGDLHGDMEKARRAFRIGGLIDQDDRWIAGSTTAVQVTP